VHAPTANPSRFPTAARVVDAGWDALELPPGAAAIVSVDHEEHLPLLRRVVEFQPGYLGLVASRRVSQTLLKRLKQDGISGDALSALRTPAGLDLGSKTLEEISLSILAELLASERGRSAYPLRAVKGLLPVQSIVARTPPPAAISTDGPELLIIGHGRIAEELARLGTLMRWRVTVNSPQAGEGDFPATSCLVTTDLDFSGMTVTPTTHVVIATMHKGDHHSMRRAVSENAAYIGLVASKKRSGLVLDYLKQEGVAEERMANIHAPAGLDLGAANPAEIALSIMCEAVASHRGGSCRPLSDVEARASTGFPGECLHQGD
jgi:xanthine/CO dehydrogenase XdhC/CoxF family maturation factor